MYGGHAIVGAHVPLATGMAFASKYRKEDRVTLCFFGDGAINQGGFHEALNLAGLFKLPVIFICENNFFAMGTSVKRSTSLAADRRSRRGLQHAERSDRRDELPRGARQTFRDHRLDPARSPHPAFVEMRTYRYRGHSMSDPASYRTKEELEKYRLEDPITRLRAQLTREGKLTQRAVRQDGQGGEGRRDGEREICREKRRSRRSRSSTNTPTSPATIIPPPNTSRPRPPTRAEERQKVVREITYRQALNEALAEEIARDPNVFLMGEEVAEYNGAYKVSQGLLDRFGADAHHRHPDQRERFCRPRHRRRHGRPAPDRRVHDLQLFVSRVRPDREQRAEHAHDVGRPVQHPDHLPRPERPRAPARRDPFARHRVPLRQRPRPENLHARHSARRQGFAQDRRARQQPRPRPRVRTFLQPQRHGRR